jgi:hypothetical protein
MWAGPAQITGLGISPENGPISAQSIFGAGLDPAHALGLGHH